jgi:hypothetical protein
MVGERKKSAIHSRVKSSRTKKAKCSNVIVFPSISISFLFFFFFCIGWRRFLFFFFFLPSSRYIALRSKWVEPAFPPKLDGVHGLGLIRNTLVVCCDSSSPSYIHQLCIKRYKRRSCAFVMGSISILKNRYRRDK